MSTFNGEPYNPEITALRAEVAELKDIIERTESFVNSMLANPKPINLKVTKTPINIPAKSAITGESYDPVLRKFGDKSLKQLVSLTRTVKPKKVRNNEDYERAMSLVGK